MKKSLLVTLFVWLTSLSLQAAAADAVIKVGDWPNPLVKERADPFLLRHSDGWYYFTGTVPEYDRIELRRAKTLKELPTAESKTIWRKHSTGAMGSHIWAPELHFIEGKWYIYFAAGGAEHVWDIRIYVLENAAANPLEGTWAEKGQLNTGWESFALDATTFEASGKRYLCWAQKDPAIEGNTNLYLALMNGPTSLVGKAVRITKPDLPWERVRYKVNEGPAALAKNGKVFIAYSASGTGAEYCMGLLTADIRSDLLDPRSWAKSPEPVFKTSEENGIFGPGHNSFALAEDAKTVLLVYHARNYREIVGDPLRDPNRHARVQVLAWKPDGSPDFGVPEKER